MARGAKKGDRGQAAFEPTNEQRELVATLAGCGISQEVICLEVKGADGEPITSRTLRKHFRVELNRGMEIANARVVKAAHKSALAGNVPMMIFWLKVRMGWKEPAQDVNVGVTYGQLVAAAFEKGRDEKAKLTVIEGGKAKAA